MKQVETASGFIVAIPNREYSLLKKIQTSGKKKFKRSQMTPRTEVLASNLVSHHVLNRDDEHFYLLPFFE